MLFANLSGLFLDKRRERIEIAGNLFSRLLLGFAQRLVEGFDLLPFGCRAGTLDRERLVNRWRRLDARGLGLGAEAIYRVLSFVLFVHAHASHREDRIRWPAVALFANPHFLAPEIALNGVA